MRIVICHCCWAWVPLDGERCPDCHHVVDLNDPDPSPARLDELIGVAQWPLGRVRCERKQLPSLGDFVGTTEGLLFLPELTALPNGALEGADQPVAPFWNLPRWWSLWQAEPVRRMPMTVAAAPITISDIGERFLNAPGAVFVPQHQLIRAALRGRTWSVSRTVGQTLRFMALAGAEEARHAWREMLSRAPAWRKLAASAP